MKDRQYSSLNKTKIRKDKQWPIINTTQKTTDLAMRNPLKPGVTSGSLEEDVS